MNSDELLKQVEKQYGITVDDVLEIFSKNFFSKPSEVKFLMECIDDLTPEDILYTINQIKNPNPSDRFVWEVNQVTILDKDGNIKSEPKDWIQFGSKIYDKRELIKKGKEV